MMSWFTRLLDIMCGTGAIVMIAMSARRVGRAVWLFALLPAIWIVMPLGFVAVSSFMERDRVGYMALNLLDASCTSIAAVLIVVACALLR
jgi:hypothetical protein